MNAAEQRREEEHFRKVEGAMLYIEDAARRLDETAEELKKDGAPAYLVTALRPPPMRPGPITRGSMKSVYWRHPPATRAS